jgi:hypothetical protein
MQFGTINRYELFYLLPSFGQWAIIDVRTFQERRGEFAYVCPRPFRSRVKFFPESKMILIIEVGDSTVKAGRFTFMPYP